MIDERYDEVLAFIKDGTLPKLSRSGQYAFKKKYSETFRNNPLWTISQLNDIDTLNYDNKIVVRASKLNDVLKELVNDPETVRFGRDSFYNKIKEKYSNISKLKAFNYLKSQEAYQLHLPLKPRRTIKSITVDGPGKYYQMDLIILKIKDLAQFNSGYKYILNIIDVFSKFLWSYALKSKSGAALANVLTSWLDQLKEKPTIVQSDNGTEFKNNEVDKIFKDRDVRRIYSDSYTPQSNGGVERVNYTMKKLLFSLLTQKKSKRWIDILGDVVNNYNSSIHSTTEETPQSIENDDANNKKVNLRIRAKRVQQPDLHNLKVGDAVRISKIVESTTRKNLIFRSAYNENWSRDIYYISKIIQSRKNTTQSRFQVEDKDKTDVGTYYAYELQKIIPPEESEESEPESEPEENKSEPEIEN